MPPGQFPVLDLRNISGSPMIGMADMRHVRAQLVGAAGDRLEREPGELVAPRSRPPRNRSRRGSRPRRHVARSRMNEVVLALLLGKDRSRCGPASAWARPRPAPSRSCAPSASGRVRPAPRRRSASSRPAGSRRYPCRADAPAAAAGPSQSRSTSSMPSRWRVVPEPPCTASPIGLLSTSTSSSSCSVIDLRKARVFSSASLGRDCGFGASSCSGGMRTACPACSRSLAVARLPFTRSSPLRMMRWMWENDRPGKPRLQEAVDAHAGFVGGDRHGLHAGGRQLAPPHAPWPASRPSSA